MLVNPGKPDHRWDKKITDIVLDPAMMLLLDLRDEESLSHDILSVLGFHETSDLDVAVSSMERFLKHLLGKRIDGKEEFSRCEVELWDRLKLKTNRSRLTRTLSTLLREKKEAIFNSKLNIFVNKTFTASQVLKIDLSFLPDEFFYDDMLHEMREKIEKPATPAFKMTGGLHFCPVKDSDSFQLSHQERFTSFLRSVMKQVMIKYGGAQGNHALGWQLGFLWTDEGAVEQDPHVDYEHKAMVKFLRNCAAKRCGKVCLPYSMDLPLQKGGMKLNYYGPDDFLFEEPLVIECPFKQCIVWRGDAVHGGGHRDINGGGGFRAHGYLHMNAGGTAGMSNTVLAIIDWRDSSKCHTRYSNYLKRSTGQPF